MPIAPFIEDLDYPLPKPAAFKPHETIRMLADIARKDHIDSNRFLRVAKLVRARIDTSEDIKRVIGGDLLGELDYAIEVAERRS